MVNISEATRVGNAKSSASYKSFGLIVPTTLVGALAGYMLNGGFILYGAVALVIFLTFFILEVLFVKKERLLYIATVVEALAFAAPFFRLVSIHFALAFALFAVFLFHGAYRGRHEMDNMVKIRFTRVIHVISRSVITAVVIFLTAVLLMSSNFRVEENRVEQIVNIASPLLERFAGEFSADTNTRVLIGNFAIRNSVKNEDFQLLPASQRQLIIDDWVIELAGRLEEVLGTEINLDSSVSANIHDIIETKLGSLTPRAQLYLALVIIATVWVSLRSVELLIYVPLSALVFLIYELLFALGFASMQLESRSKEIISL